MPNRAYRSYGYYWRNGYNRSDWYNRLNRAYRCDGCYRHNRYNGYYRCDRSYR